MLYEYRGFQAWIKYCALTDSFYAENIIGTEKVGTIIVLAEKVQGVKQGFREAVDRFFKLPRNF